MSMNRFVEVTALSGDDDYVSKWFDRSDGCVLAVGIHGYTDTASEEDGVVIEESDKPSDQDMTHVVATGTADADAPFNVLGTLHRHYWRVRYVSTDEVTKFQLHVTGYSVVPVNVDRDGNAVMAGGSSTVTANQGSAGTSAWKTDPNAAERDAYVASVSSISNVLETPNDRTLYPLTIFRPTSSARNVRVLRVAVRLLSNDQTGNLDIDLVRLTSAPTSGSGVTPIPLDPAQQAAASVVKKSPSVSVTGSPDVLYGMRMAVDSSSASALGSEIILYEWQPASGAKPLKIRSSTAEGYGLRLMHSVDATVVCGVRFEFTEE